MKTFKQFCEMNYGPGDKESSNISIRHNDNEGESIHPKNSKPDVRSGIVSKPNIAMPKQNPNIGPK